MPPVTLKSTTTTCLALLIGCVLLPSCATIFTGSHDDVTFNSEPGGARIFIDGIERGPDARHHRREPLGL